MPCGIKRLIDRQLGRPQLLMSVQSRHAAYQNAGTPRVVKSEARPPPAGLLSLTGESME